VRRIIGGVRWLTGGAGRHAAAQATVQRIVDEDQVVYGINTGFGKLASTRSPTTPGRAAAQPGAVAQRGHGRSAARRGALVLATKAVSLARGHSGVRPNWWTRCWRWPMPMCCP
jgi:histidine ammonia-lyase